MAASAAWDGDCCYAVAECAGVAEAFHGAYCEGVTVRGVIDTDECHEGEVVVAFGGDDGGG